jgi:hypothetical protein
MDASKPEPARWSADEIKREEQARAARIQRDAAREAGENLGGQFADSRMAARLLEDRARERR